MIWGFNIIFIFWNFIFYMLDGNNGEILFRYFYIYFYWKYIYLLEIYKNI